ncbi:uncharacterized protein haspin isoform X2 [Gouania willdenowi]|uniref:uncharacterized protein haspin isoform X2 n=1 Tax=Gouania willdenowi TaxID=441366 RepID=UPI001055ED9C|nr:serine/threonine-protein kinase haspin isoform X2 [Gouania willdenowi]
MKPLKPLYLKTYGKQKRQLSAWISPDDRKQAFESTASSDGSMSDLPKQKKARKTTVGRCRAVRTAKEKALRFLMEQSSVDDISINGGNAPSSSCTVSRRKTLVSNVRVSRSRTKRPIETSTDEENVEPSRESLLVSVTGILKCPQDSVSNVSEVETIPSKRHKNPVSKRMPVKTNSSSAGRFVTRRRQGLTSKPSVAKATISLLSSSDDFTARDFSSRRIQRASKRRRAPPPILASSAENSLNPLREISLNDLMDPSLAPGGRKPMFCSTPSAGSISKPGHLKRFLNNYQSSTPPSISVSYIQDLSPCQGNPLSPSHAKEKLQNTSDVQQLGDPSADLFLEHTTGSSSEDPKIRNSVESASVHLLSTDCDGNSQFVSAAGGFDWLIDALKRKCSTEDCKVHLERLDYDTVAQLCSQTGYSTCFEHSNQQAKEQAEAGEKGCSANDSLHKSPFSSKTVDGFDPAGHSANISLLDVIQQSAEVSCTKTSPKNDTYQHQNSKKSKNLRIQNGYETTSDITQLDENGCRRSSKSSSCPVAESPSTEADRPTAALTTRLKEECANRKCSLPMKRTSSLQIKDAAPKSSLVINDQTKTWIDSNQGKKEVSSTETNVKSQSSSSDDQLVKHKIVPRKKMSLAAREKKGRGVSTDRPETARKACVSGLSVNRWKTKDNSNKHKFIGGAALIGQNKFVNCSINDLIPKRSSHTQELLETNMNFSTPLRTNGLVLTSVLANLTPNTPTWSRLKAALSVHRKVMLTPKFLAPGSPGSNKLSNVSQDLFGATIRTPVAKRFQSQLLSQTSLDVCDGAELSDAEKVCAECGQQQPLPWEGCILPERIKRCVKIGEGTFGEVFSTTNSSGDTVALKIIPVEGSETVNGEDQKTFGEILHEIIISKELSSLKKKQHNQTYGFIGLNDLHCVQGCYPPDFLNAWDTFDQRKGSENDRPDFFEKDQLFIILEFEFGGVDLENSNGTLASLVVAKSVLHQVTASLAVAEQELHFEHRDLHWGNVLVKPTTQKKGSFLLNGTDHCMEIKGVLVRIIDYSLSRLEIDDLTVSCDISNDEELFMGQGDYQFEIYRLMRKENKNNWSSYRPHTNVLWLHYLCAKLLSMKYRSSGGRTVKEMRKELTRFHDNVLHYSSATEVLQSCPLFQ